MTFSKYNSLNYLKYLNNCDLNYKYFLKSINETPEIDKIIFELPTNMLPSIELTEDDNQTRLLLKCFLAFYFINLKIPYINCNKFKNDKIIKGTNNSFHYSYLLSYNNFVEKYNLISILLNENDHSNNNVKNLTKLKTKLNLKKHKVDKLNFKVDIHAIRTSEYKEILNLIFTRNELQKLKFNLSIIFKNLNNKIISVEELKNFFYIWNI